MIGLETQSFSAPALAICLAYYALLLSSLWGCRGVGGWAARFYELALGVVVLHVALMLPLFIGFTKSDMMSVLALFCVVGVYIACSAAGAALAWRTRKWWQCGMQITWPLILFGGPIVIGPWALSGLLVVVTCLLAYGLQGLQAMFLALSLEYPDFALSTPEPADIGFDVVSR